MREFEDDAFYPVIIEDNIRTGIYHKYVAQCSNQCGMTIFWITQNDEVYSVEDFEWIGKEIKIEWDKRWS